MERDQVTISVDLVRDYQFLVDFHLPGVPELLMDEPSPLGADAGPNASRLLAAAIANCLSASMLFCLRKAHVEVSGMRSSASVSYVRDERGRLRVGSVSVDIRPQIDPAHTSRFARCRELFEDFCVVTQSVRAGVTVSVQVATDAGQRGANDPAVGEPTG